MTFQFLTPKIRRIHSSANTSQPVGHVRKECQQATIAIKKQDVHIQIQLIPFSLYLSRLNDFFLLLVLLVACR